MQILRATTERPQHQPFMNRRPPPAPAVIPLPHLHPAPPRPPTQCHSSYILHPPSWPCCVRGTASSAVCAQPKLSVRLPACVTMWPQPQLHSYYLLIIADAAATGSTITKRAECKSVTFVLTLFVDILFFFSSEWWHVKCSPGGCSNLEQYGNWEAGGS